MSLSNMATGWLRGVVKEVPAGDTLVIVGTAKQGPPPEKRITLSSLIAPKLVRVHLHVRHPHASGHPQHAPGAASCLDGDAVTLAGLTTRRSALPCPMLAPPTSQERISPLPLSGLYVASPAARRSQCRLSRCRLYD